MVLVFTIVSAIQEKLTVMVEDSKRRKQEEIERKKRQLEEEEQVLSREGEGGGGVNCLSCASFDMSGGLAVYVQF